MYSIYIKSIEIEEVRHLKNIVIPLADNMKKNLILTGKNGSGKTSVLNALSNQLDYLATQGDFSNINKQIEHYETRLKKFKSGWSDNQIFDAEKQLKILKQQLQRAKSGLCAVYSESIDGLKSHFDNGDFVLAYYEATRKFEAIVPKHVEKITLKDNYGIRETPRNEFVKYILDLKMTEALANNSGKAERAQRIHDWFDNFELLLKQIFHDDSVKLLFDEETFGFSIYQDGRNSFDFNELSDGYAAILDIVVDLMIRMQKHLGGAIRFDLPGIVLIDEIETHLHLALQKEIMGFLTGIFPNIQFIISTHSPFILSGADNSVIFDLESKVLVSEGLMDFPYDGIVRGYFEVDDLSKELRGKFNRYKELVAKADISDEEMHEIAGLELYLDEIPDYLALEISTEYHRLKLEFEKREVL